MYKFVAGVLLLPGLAACAGHETNDVATHAGNEIWIDPDAERGRECLSGEARDGLCDMRDQAMTERLAEAYRKREARVRKDKLESELQTYMDSSDKAEDSDESPLTVGNDDH